MIDALKIQIRPIMARDHATRLALMLAYRNGLRESPQRAWDDAFAMTQERFPILDDVKQKRLLLYCLGTLGATDDLDRIERDGKPFRQDSFPYLISLDLGFRLSCAARHIGLNTDELISRVLATWLEAACGLGCEPGEEYPIPEAPGPKTSYE